ncbi:MAG TPA: hypothetical protein PLP42_17760 [Acidobacteriota bacterium]|nr:hypothetical protein [Acidobacteriota bacterium]
MTKTTFAGLAFAAVFVLLGLIAGYWVLDRSSDRGDVTSLRPAPAVEAHPSFLYGRVVTVAGQTYEGRLRWGSDQEAFWDDHFNGVRVENRWAAYLPPEQLSTQGRSIKVFGIKIGSWERQTDLRRLFMVRFGDITRIEAVGVTRVRVTLKSGTVIDLNRSDASDFDDGVRVWDSKRGVVDINSLWIRSIELLQPERSSAALDRLYGTVQTQHGEFTGFVQWNRAKGIGSDELSGRAGDDHIRIRFDTIRSIAGESRTSSRITLRDGREIVLSGTSDTGRHNQGIYVDDPRYGRVLISWDVFERVDFNEEGAGLAGSGPVYSDFPPGYPLTGTVTTRQGRRLAGRLVYDLDESETTDTLDAPLQGVDYFIPFGLITSLRLSSPENHDGDSASLILVSGEELSLERRGDLSDANRGMLVFVEEQHAEFVPWDDIERIDFERPPPVGEPKANSRKPEGVGWRR